MNVEILIAEQCCLCYGAKRALNGALEATKTHKQVVLLKELLHNKKTVRLLTDAGAVEKESIENISPKDFVVVRAHGEPKSTIDFFEKNKIEFVDLTCPNVVAIHNLVQQKSQQGWSIILLGKRGKFGSVMHPEIFGTKGWCGKEPQIVEDEEDVQTLCTDDEKYFLVVQTTFNFEKAQILVDLIKKKIESAGKVFDFKMTTCFAQKNINISSAKLAKNVDVMIVVGGKNSSNTKELFANVSCFCKSFFVEDDEDLEIALQNLKKDLPHKIGLTGGASTTIDELCEIKSKIKKFFQPL